MDWDDDELPEPPAEAYADEGSREINDEWLRQANQDDQVAAMLQWFRARFCDPAHETPYMSSEGGYIWIHGGPYEASEQLGDRFSGIASDDAIEEAVEAAERNGIADWAPTYLTYYDEEQDVFVDERNDPTKSLEQRLDKLAEVLSLEGEGEARETARNLAYAGVISALETFLWETMAFWVEDNEVTVVNLITKHPVFRDRSIRLGDIYQISKQLKLEVKAHMQRVVWHRADSVSPLFKHGLVIDLGFRDFDDALQKRHDIVHRFGHDSNGKPIQTSNEDVQELAAKVLVFANEVDAKIVAAQAVATTEF